MTPKARRGLVFRHTRFLDPSFVPGPGQRYADAPKAACRVTGVRDGMVYYAVGAEATKGRYLVAEEKFWNDIVAEVLP